MNAKAMTETILDIIGAPGDWERVEDYLQSEVALFVGKVEASLEQLSSHCHGQRELDFAHGNTEGAERWQHIAAGVRCAIDEFRHHAEAAIQ